MNRHAESSPGVKQQTLRFAEQQKAAGADKIAGVADVIHGAADEMENQMPQAAAYVHDAAGRIEQAAEKIKERSLDDLLTGIGDFARHQPAAFFGGAVLAGFALSRFLKSSASAHRG